MDLKGRTIFMSGGSRGIGLAIALRAARDGANVALMAKTSEPHPRLPGTIHEAAEAIEAAGGHALAQVGDVRDDAAVQVAVDAAAEHFGGIDICVNNASAINLAGTLDLEPRRFDLMQQINVRGTFVVSRACLPYLVRGENSHILTLSPPLNLAPRWLGANPGYMLSKYGMTLLTLGFAEEFREQGVAANCLWPRTLIATAAVQNLLGGDESMARARTPEIMADAAHAILVRDAREATATCFMDDEVLGAGPDDYRAGEGELALDIFVDGPMPA